MDDLFRLPSATRDDPKIADWFGVTDPLRLIAKEWFDRAHACGPDVMEVLHDGCPTACVGDAAFAYVNAFKAHANIGFFHGAELPDPAGLLQGTGKRMRHVKLRLGTEMDSEALSNLIDAAYEDIRRRLRQA